MNNFEHVNATSLESAVRLLDNHGQSRAIAGGTDLLTEMKSRISIPERLVNLKTIPDMDKITFDKENGLHIRSLATLNSLAKNETIKNKYPILIEAISSAATNQIRNQGTLGGNLLQDTRCWYYRGSFKCWLKGGDICYARVGQNRYHAIFNKSPCQSVAPSDLAVALVALKAKLKIFGSNGNRTMPLEELYQMPHVGIRRLTAISASDIIEEIQIPAPLSNSRGIFLKAMDRKAWAFAMVNVAAYLAFENETIKEARIVLGGVAAIPHIVPKIETTLEGKRLDEEIINRSAELAVAGSRPLGHNLYKIPLAREMVKQALNSLK